MTAKNIAVVDEEIFDESEEELVDSQLPVVCHQNRHFGKIEGSNLCLQCWRMKERMKTVSVALVLCLNVGVDPPDVVKISPCARMECWIDPHTMSPQKALESIGSNLQKQYERWQPKARYKQSLDPTVEEMKKLCVSLRRNAKEERVLFHYIGHGVPKPTSNGEIWVFNKSYTQYIPLSLYDLQVWMGSPSIYVFDCSNAGIIIDLFRTFTAQREQEAGSTSTPLNAEQSIPSSIKNSILLAACGSTEHLPMNPDLPADLFTSCLTTPIKVALRWYVLQNRSLVPGLTMEMVDKIPGQLSDRRTMLGELNWIFTAITDTIAWNSLPRELFQKLFRQDLLVASLFRNFLLAERIMRSYNCIPISNPKLPSTHQHTMWQAWDLALDLCLQQLTLKPLMADGMTFLHSPFFAEQLTAFKVWLDFGSETRRPPEQLPIVLQVLLSQVHRVRALDLLGKFLDLGHWAVNLALSVGIFPYVLKLLQSSAKELRPLLVFIWAKILAVDPSCQIDLVKDSGHKYFLGVLSETSMAAEHRTMAAFVMAIIMNNYAPGREAALKDNTISICLEQLGDANPHLRQWLALCLAKVWSNFDNARWCGVRDRAHEKLSKLLSDPEPEVRAAAIFALGTFVSRAVDRTDHSVAVDVNVGNLLVACITDGSPLVRKELVVAFGGYVSVYLSHFVNIVKKIQEEEEKGKERMVMSLDAANMFSHKESRPDSFASGGMKRSHSRGSFKSLTTSASSHQLSSMASSASSDNLSDERLMIRRVSSGASIAGQTFVTVYSSMWQALNELAADPHLEVAAMSRSIITAVKKKALTTARPRQVVQAVVSQNNHTLSSSPSRPANMPFGTPPQNMLSPGSAQYSFGQSTRKVLDKTSPMPDEAKEEDNAPISEKVTTQFFDWSCKYFAEPFMCLKDYQDPESSSYHQREYRFLRNARVRSVGRDQLRAGVSRLDDQMFVNRVGAVPTAIKFHPYENFLAVADSYNVSFWDLEQGTKISDIPNPAAVDRVTQPLIRVSRITSIDFMNAHDQALFMFCTDDGAIRIYRNFLSPYDADKELVTAFKGLSELVPSERGSGLVTEWEQETSTLITSGNARIIRLWDMQKEKKLSDISTGAESCVTSLASDPLGKSLLIAGCGDGSVRLFDRRLNPAECRVMTLKEHNSWVLKVHLQRGSEGKIVSACCDGDIRFWDPRFTDSVRVYNTPTSLSSVDIHPRADIIACGSTNQCMTAYSPNGTVLSTVKYHEGFLGQRIGNASCMSFHPYQIKLATGSADCFVSIYTTARNVPPP
ncbi:regulatory-associated protein of mTOR-like isoform X2 [Physella acuta]|uniref:regulatory-associated protein of mTOR-like isoform X2 n=1 Tax=Physella acuta TaxID=109671 RepID=UPI0027DCA35E|nr:regulatory-associated protein of mTOR-like isoform X2 [Physella acuta]